MDAPTLTRSWPSLAAVGAGLIQLALGAGGVTAAGGGAASLAPAVALVGLGAATAVWGVVSLASGRAVVPALGVAGVLAGIVACAWALAADPTGVSVLAASAAWLLLAVLGAFCAVELRRRRRIGSDAVGGGRTGVVGILVGAAAVAALVTPALAATEVGRLAPDHTEHSVTVVHSH